MVAELTETLYATTKQCHMTLLQGVQTFRVLNVLTCCIHEIAGLSDPKTRNIVVWQLREEVKNSEIQSFEDTDILHLRNRCIKRPKNSVLRNFFGGSKSQSFWNIKILHLQNRCNKRPQKAKQCHMTLFWGVTFLEFRKYTFLHLRKCCNKRPQNSVLWLFSKGVKILKFRRYRHFAITK